MTISCQLSIITLLITSNIINHQLGPTNQSRLCLLFVPVVATQQRWEWWRCSILVEIKTSRCRSRLPILICCWDAGRVVRVRLRVRVRVAILHLTDCRGGGWPLLWRGFGTWLPCHSFALGCNCNLHWFHRWLCFGFHLHGLHSFLCICTTAPGTCTSCGCGRHSFGTRHHKCWQWISSDHEQVWYKHILPWLRDHCTLTMTCTIRSDLLTLRMKRRGPSIKSSPWFWNVFQSLQQKKVWTVRQKIPVSRWKNVEQPTNPSYNIYWRLT